MNTYKFRYLYDNKYSKEFKCRIERGPEEILRLNTTVINDATILPGKSDVYGSPPWGVGGGLDNNGKFVPESGIISAFGGQYEYDHKNVDYIDNTVIHINVIPKHWGHFIIDVACRLWLAIESDPDIKITYCGWKLEDEGIQGNFLQFFELLGIAKSRLLYIRKPTVVKQLIIPDASFRFDGSYNHKYRVVFEKICKNVLQQYDDRPYPDKIYLTRTRLKKARFYEIGEKEIEKSFQKNGFHIVSPETLTLAQQIMLFQKANIIASLSGTLPHNIVFTRKDTKIVILNRTCMLNLPQIGLNKMFERDITYVDVYNRVIENKPVVYGEGPLWIESNCLLAKWFEDMGCPFTERLSEYVSIRTKNYCLWNILRVCHLIYKSKCLRSFIKI